MMLAALTGNVFAAGQVELQPTAVAGDITSQLVRAGGWRGERKGANAAARLECGDESAQR